MPMLLPEDPIPERLRLYRQRAGFTAEEVAKVLGVSRATVFNWENGTSEPRLSQGGKLSLLYKVSISMFLPQDERYLSPHPFQNGTPVPHTPSPEVHRDIPHY